MKRILMFLMLAGMILPMSCSKDDSDLNKDTPVEEGDDIVEPEHQVDYRKDALTKEQLAYNSRRVKFDLEYYEDVKGNQSQVARYKLDTTLFRSGTLQNDERVLTYVMPKNLSDNYDIVFELHPNYPVGSQDANDIELRQSHMGAIAMKKVLEERNAILLIPLGSKSVPNEWNGNNSSSWGWYVDNGDMYFLDILVEALTQQVRKQKGFNVRDIYVSGQSSGAIFTWALSLYRRDTYSAIVSRFGQYTTPLDRGTGDVVPLKAIFGSEDIGITAGGMDEAEMWAQKINLIDTDPELSEIEYLNNGRVRTGDVRVWQGEDERNYLETCLLDGCGHGLFDEGDNYKKLVYDFFMKFRKR